MEDTNPKLSVTGGPSKNSSVFEITTSNGELLFSKAAKKRFPTEEEWIAIAQKFL
jgi:hypothetical protein